MSADADTKRPAVDYGQIANLRAIRSAVSGKIRVIDHGDGATVLLSLISLPPGAYRIAIGETPNCTSPNGFSAGRPWAPEGRDPRNLIPIQYDTAQDHVERTLHVSGLRARGVNGVAGHSVILFGGSEVTDAVPDVPNERMACGVFEAGQGLDF